MTTQALGEEGFIWFIGVVESRDDPYMLGRLQVRIYNINSPKQSKTSTSELPWATIMSPVTGACNNRVGQAPLGIQVGTTVIGFFTDGNDKNNPVILGAIAGIPGLNAEKHDVPSEAREVNLINKQPIGPEPASAYRAKYPYNKVIRTESGHVIEVDDTPNFERLHIFHKSGSYIEVNETGRVVMKSADDSFNIVAKDNQIYVGGNVNLEVGGTVTGKASSWTITGDVTINGNVTTNGNINASGEISDGKRSMSSDRSIYDSHVHPDAQGGTTGTPSSTM
jgi:hypothetical protein